MGSIEIQLVLVFVLVLINAAFAGSEIALISLREGQIQRLEEGGGTGRLLARLTRAPNQFLSTIQIGITLAGFLASATATVAFAELLVEPLSFLGAAARPTAIVLVTLVLTFVTLVFGELAPKRVAMQRSEGWALLAARPLSLLATLARPAVWLLGRSTDLVVRLTGGDPSQQREEVTDEELRDMLSSRSGFTAQQRHIVEGAFEITERTVDEIAVPRTSVVWVDVSTSTDETLRTITRAGFSRAPVCEGDLDHVAGVVHVRDLIGADSTAGAQARPALEVPESVHVLEALRQLQGERQHLAVVVDEHGGTFGIVTLEDVLEELVGEIYDEFDRDVASVQREQDGSVIVPGGFPVHDLHDIDVALPQGDYATVAGLVLHHLQRLPSGGETVVVGRCELTVEGVRGRAITRVRIRRLEEDPVDPQA